MLISNRMQDVKTPFGDYYDPRLHRLNVTLQQLVYRRGLETDCIMFKAIPMLNDDLKRLKRSKHSPNAYSKDIYNAAMEQYLPLLERLKVFFQNNFDATSAESYFEYMKRKGVDWNVIQFHQRFKKRLRAQHEFYYELKRQLKALARRRTPALEEYLDILDDFKETYVYTGQLHAAYDIAAFPQYFRFIPKDLVAKCKQVFENGDFRSTIAMGLLFADIQKTTGKKSTFELYKQLGTEETHFFD